MASAAAEHRPERGFKWLKEQSRPDAVAIIAVGALALLVLIVGVPGVLATYDFTPIPNLVEGLKSGELRVVLIATVVLGAAALIAGAVRARAMPTKVSREEAASGAILGAQA